MAIAAATDIIGRLFLQSPPVPSLKFRLFLCLHRPYLHLLHHNRRLTSSSVVPISNITTAAAAGGGGGTRTGIRGNKSIGKSRLGERVSDLLVKRRTRSDREFDEASVLRYGDDSTHVPVMLGEVLEAFASVPLRSFVDCTLGAAGHSSAIIQAHPELQLYIGLDVDPSAHKMAEDRINGILCLDSCSSTSDLKAHTFVRNFKDIKLVLNEIERELLAPGFDGILMDLGMSSMQVNNAERGFSVLNNGPLDMRMNPQGCDRQV